MKLIGTSTYHFFCLHHESPFYLLHRRDPCLPTASVLNHVRSPYIVATETALTVGLSEAWSNAQEKQKCNYDKHAKELHYKHGDRVMVYMPSAVKGKAWKLARPFYGPYLKHKQMSR